MSVEREQQQGTGLPDEPGMGAPAAAAEPPQRKADRHSGGANMLPGRERRRFGIERVFTRLVATCGVVGIGVAIGAIMVSSKSPGWIVGLVVAIVSVLVGVLLLPPQLTRPASPATINAAAHTLATARIPTILIPLSVLGAGQPICMPVPIRIFSARN